MKRKMLSHIVTVDGLANRGLRVVSKRPPFSAKAFKARRTALQEERTAARILKQKGRVEVRDRTKAKILAQQEIAAAISAARHRAQQILIPMAPWKSCLTHRTEFQDYCLDCARALRQAAKRHREIALLDTMMAEPWEGGR